MTLKVSLASLHHRGAPGSETQHPAAIERGAGIATGQLRVTVRKIASSGSAVAGRMSHACTLICKSPIWLCPPTGMLTCDVPPLNLVEHAERVTFRARHPVIRDNRRGIGRRRGGRNTGRCRCTRRVRHGRLRHDRAGRHGRLHQPRWRRRNRSGWRHRRAGRVRRQSSAAPARRSRNFRYFAFAPRRARLMAATWPQQAKGAWLMVP